MEIKQVQTAGQLKQFILLPYKVYKNDPFWVPPLMSETKELFSSENPFWKHSVKALFIVYDGKNAVGRIAAIIDENHNKFHGEKCGFFGFFECFENVEISRLLFQASEIWLREKGMKIVRGPVNPSTNDECGLLIDGFDDPPQIMMTYNKPYYVDFITDGGFYKAKDLLAFIMNVGEGPAGRLMPLAERVLKRNPQISVRRINMKDFAGEVETIMDIYNSAWEKNWGFVPMTRDEIYYLAKKLKQVIDPEILWISFYGRTPAGFLMALPNLNEALKKINGLLTPVSILKLLYFSKRIKSLRLITLGVKKQFQKLGLEILLYAKSLEAASRKGYKKCEFSWILEDNVLTNRAAEMMAGKVYKKYRIFEKPL
ncbi:MAG: hypothetical protein ABIJ15_06600 [bacterium]